MNKKGQFRDFEDLFKAIVTGIIGIIFLTALAPIVSQTVSESFIGLGVFMIILAIIISIISVVIKIMGSGRHF